MPVAHQKHRRLSNMEDGGKEDENTDGNRKVRRNIFGTTLTEEDRRRMDEEMQEMNENAKRKLMNYEIVDIEATFDKPEKPEPKPSNEAKSEENQEKDQEDK